jgi:hypothetical protein
MLLRCESLEPPMSQMGLGCAKTKSDLVVMPSGRPKIPGAVIPREQRVSREILCQDLADHRYRTSQSLAEIREMVFQTCNLIAESQALLDRGDLIARARGLQ